MDENIWMIDDRNNTIVAFNIKRNDIDTMIQLPRRVLSKLANVGIVIKEKVYFYAYDSSFMYVKEKDEISEIFSDTQASWKRVIERTPIINGNSILLFPLKEDAPVLEIDMINNIIRNKIEFCEAELQISAAIEIEENSILLSFYERNFLYLVGIDGNNKLSKQIINVGEWIRDICVDDDYIYALTGQNSLIYLFDKKNMRLVQTINLHEKKEKAFQLIINCGNYLFVVQRNADYSLCIDKKTFTTKKVEDSELNSIRHYSWVNKRVIWLRENKVKTEKIILFDIIEKSISVLGYSKTNIISYMIKKNTADIVYEEKIFCLKDYINALS